MKYAADYLVEQKRPSWTPVTRIAESGACSALSDLCCLVADPVVPTRAGETAVFKGYFANWTEAPKRTLEEKKAGKPVPRAPEVESLYKQQKQAEEKMADDGKGKIEIWRIENFKQVPVRTASPSQCFSFLVPSLD